MEFTAEQIASVIGGKVEATTIQPYTPLQK